MQQVKKEMHGIKKCKFFHSLLFIYLTKKILFYDWLILKMHSKNEQNNLIFKKEQNF